MAYIRGRSEHVELESRVEKFQLGVVQKTFSSKLPLRRPCANLSQILREHSKTTVSVQMSFHSDHSTEDQPPSFPQSAQGAGV